MRPCILFTLSIALAVPASAAETITYSYDARGRLVTVVRTGPSDATTAYVYDKADNRTNVTTTTGGGGGMAAAQPADAKETTPAPTIGQAAPK